MATGIFIHMNDEKMDRCNVEAMNAADSCYSLTLASNSEVVHLFCDKSHLLEISEKIQALFATEERR